MSLIKAMGIDLANFFSPLSHPNSFLTSDITEEIVLASLYVVPQTLNNS
ncbi:hypothetical protein Q4493_07260 [Colwellia sp. 1_MG-2023]|nr:hypothetical protein [Colwellia sp. 1_MG-2023]MDO6445571.1 hypothetical protein [Colwellia sp. 1_MG-2023]